MPVIGEVSRYISRFVKYQQKMIKLLMGRGIMNMIESERAGVFMGCRTIIDCRREVL